MTAARGKPKSATPQISRERENLISRYATAAGFLYGLISVSDFVGLFKHYEDDKTDEQETIGILERLAKNDGVEYSLFDGCVLGPHLIPEFQEDIENAAILRAEQKNKPRYLPDKKEFLRYVDPEYYEPEKPYSDLKAYILKHKLNTRKGLDGVDGDLIDLREMIQTQAEIKECIQYFVDRGYTFKNTDDLDKFLQRVTDAYNNTRLFENNGFTPKELFEFENYAP